MTAVLTWLLGSRVGRWVALASLVAAAIGAALLRGVAAGKASERARHAQRSLNNLRKRVKTDDEISAMAPGDRRERLRQWVRDNG